MTLTQSIRSSKKVGFANNFENPEILRTPLCCSATASSFGPKCPLGRSPNGHFGSELSTLLRAAQGCAQNLGIFDFFAISKIFEERMLWVPRGGRTSLTHIYSPAPPWNVLNFCTYTRGRYAPGPNIPLRRQNHSRSRILKSPRHMPVPKDILFK